MKLFIILMMFISCLTPIKAITTDEKFELYDILILTELYENGKNYKIGDTISHYFTSDRYSINYKIFPVYENDKLVGLIFDDNNGNYSIGVYYADVLNSIIDTNSKFELIFHMNQVYVMQNSKIQLITKPTSIASTNSVTNLTTRDYGNEITGIPNKAMNSSEDCWAACMAAIIEYKGLYTTTSSVVSLTGNNSMASIQNVSSYLINLYHINNNLYTYALSFNNAMLYVGNYQPIIAACDKVGGGSGHMVVIKGVYYLTNGNNNAMYKLMDPYSSSTINVITTTSMNLSFVSYAGNTYQWASSIVII